MGSIVTVEKVDKATGKAVKEFRAHVRRTGYASKSKVCKTLTEAKQWLRENEATTSLVKAGQKGSDTFRKLVEVFVDTPPTKGTRYWKPSQLDFWIEQFGDMKVEAISRKNINAAIALLQTRPVLRMTPDGLKPTDQHLTSGTVNRYLATLASVFNFAVAREIIDSHPMKGGKVNKLTESKGRKRILTGEEETHLLDAAESSTWPMMRLYVRILLTTAARKSEVLNLKWRDVRLDESLAILHDTKNGSDRALPLVSDVKIDLEAAKKVRPLHSDFVFYDPRHPERPKNIDTIWRFVRERAGLLNDREDRLDRVVLHSTRHTAVTKMIKGGANLSQVANVSGHKTLAMLKRYEHLAAEDAVDLAQRLLAGDGAK